MRSQNLSSLEAAKKLTVVYAERAFHTRYLNEARHFKQAQELTHAFEHLAKRFSKLANNEQPNTFTIVQLIKSRDETQLKILQKQIIEPGGSDKTFVEAIYELDNIGPHKDQHNIPIPYLKKITHLEQEQSKIYLHAWLGVRWLSIYIRKIPY